MSGLADRRCVPCRGGVPPLPDDQVRALLAQLDDWTVPDGHHLVRRWRTRDFQTALDLANAFGRIAEAEGHHPVLELSWGWIEARIWTHEIDGLTESDFVLAAKYDRAARR